MQHVGTMTPPEELVPFLLRKSLGVAQCSRMHPFCIVVLPVVHDILYIFVCQYLRRLFSTVEIYMGMAMSSASVDWGVESDVDVAGWSIMRRAE